jgi:hypothetical protein
LELGDEAIEGAAALQQNAAAIAERNAVMAIPFGQVMAF